ncbi:MAG: ATP-binding protein [bacterium]|nr:ATP-binding protein [bacterium]
MSGKTRFTPPQFSNKILIIVGGFGSGKSEVSVNLAAYLARTSSEAVTIADLDVINPYFRSREAASQLASLGVKSLIPGGENVHADLPIVIPEVKGAIEEPGGTLILDVGGDDLGARVLSSLRDAFPATGYDLLLTHNANRPFTSDLEGTLKVMSEIEGASRMKFTGIICNTHLMKDTTSEVVLTGLKQSREVSATANVPIVFLSAVTEVLETMDPELIDCPILPLNRSLLKPWERQAPTGGN